MISSKLGPVLGRASVAQQTVDLAVKDYIQTLAKTHLDLVSETFEKLRNDPTYYTKSGNGIPYKHIKDGFCNIPRYLIEKLDPKEPRFYAHFSYSIDEIDQNTPSGNLLLSLAKDISQIGIECHKVEVRLEKGCFESSAEYWHVDGPASDRSISICYSNVMGWCTRILDDEYISNFFNTIYDVPNDLYDKSNGDLSERIESLSRSSEFGVFYDVRKILHRSPRETDINVNALSVNDFRLFMRFTKEYGVPMKSKF
jgi:hypothetical protein